MINGRIISSVNTASADWQMECWKLAQGKKKFQLEGLADHHRTFCEELCLAYGYRMECSGKNALFLPLDHQ
jgi:hypothetical protein